MTEPTVDSLRAALRESEAIYRSLVESLPMSVLRKDVHGRIQHANRRACESIGVPVAELVGKTDADLFPDELALRYIADDQEVVQSGKLQHKVERHRRPDGRMIHVEVWKAPIFSDSGNIIGVQVLFWDVSDQKDAENQKEFASYLLETLLNHSADSIYFKDAESRFIRMSKACAQKLGADSPQETIGQSDADFFAESFARKTREDEDNILRTGKPIENEIERELFNDGSEKWSSTTKMPLIDVNGQVIGTFGISRDVTARKEMEDQMLAARQAAEAANQAKSDFLANMSHEIRTPMNAIMGMTDLLLETQLDSTQRDFLSMVSESAESLLSVINDILDFSKIEAGHLELDHQPFEIRELFGDTLKTLGVRADAAELELAFRIHPSVSPYGVGDAGRIRQVLINLVGNAIKFTPQGEVVVEVKPLDSNENSFTLEVEVRDTGIGIRKEKLKSIFEAFRQADTSTTRRFGGTGLGLAISTRLIRLMGGELSVESEVGVGSVFRFTTILGNSNESLEGLGVVGAARVIDCKVLIVDDNTTNRLILEELTRNWSMNPVTLDGPDAALRWLRNQKQSVDLIITDIHMPKMDGYEFISTARKQGLIEGVPVIALTSGSRLGDLDRKASSGIAAKLMKPVKQSELFDAIVNSLDHGSSTTLDSEATDGNQSSLHASDGSSKHGTAKILLVEDNLVNQKLAASLLRRDGHVVTIAGDGAIALEHIKSEQRFDIILMDVQMPNMDGLTATTEIRRWESESNRDPVPIVAMTAHAMRGDREKCIAAGMDEYLAKPIRIEKLREQIQRWHRPSTTEMSKTVSASRDAESEHQENADTAASSSVANVDHSLFRLGIQNCGGDVAMYRELLSLYVREIRALVDRIEVSMQSESPDFTSRLVHSLKGASMSVGMSQLVERCEAVESELESDHGINEAAFQSNVNALLENAKDVLEHCIKFLDGESNATQTRFN